MEQVLGSSVSFDLLKECVAGESSKVLWLFLFIVEYWNMDSNMLSYTVCGNILYERHNILGLFLIRLFKTISDV